MFYPLRARAILFLAALCCGLCHLIFSRVTAHSGQLVPLTLRIGTRTGMRTVPLTALLDTGNTLKDPLTGDSVLVVDGSIAAQLLPDAGLSTASLADPAGLFASLSEQYPFCRFRLIPYRAVGTVSGLLLACYAEVLARWSSRDEFTLNVTLFNRLPLHPEVGEIVGDFTSVSLLACSFDGTASFLRRARALQAQLWADMDHSTFSGVEVIREWSRCTGRSSADIIPIVFTSTIGFGDEHGTHPALRTFGRMVYNITQTPQVWIDHQVREVDDCLEFNWDAVDELFPEGLVDSMFSAYCRLLRMWTRCGKSAR